MHAPRSALKTVATSLTLSAAVTAAAVLGAAGIAGAAETPTRPTLVPRPTLPTRPDPASTAPTPPSTSAPTGPAPTGPAPSGPAPTGITGITGDPGRASTPPGLGLEALKRAAQAQIDARIKLETEMVRRLEAAQSDCGFNQALKAELNGQIAGLTELGAKIQATTDLATARKLYTSIFVDFRVYKLEVPKSHIVGACNRLIVATGKLQQIHDRIQAALDAAKAKGADTSEAQKLLDDLQKQIDTANSSTKDAAASVMALQPDHGVESVIASNDAAIRAARAKLDAARAAIKTAREDLRLLLELRKGTTS